MLETSSRGTSTRIHSPTAGNDGQLHRRSGPIDHDEPRSVEHLFEALPGRQPRGGVVADDGEELRAREPFTQLSQGVGREADPAPRDLEVARLDALDTLDRRRDHREPVRRTRDQPPALLLPGAMGDDQQHHVERECVAHVDRRDQMADVRWVERAAEQTNAARWVTRHGAGV